MSTYFDTALAGELADLRGCESGRNNALFRTAARLYAFCEVGVCEEPLISAQLEQAGGALGLTASEIRTTLKSAQKRAAQLDAQARQELAAKCRGAFTIVAPAEVCPPEDVDAPCAAWQEKAAALVDWAQRRLWNTQSTRATEQRDYLRIGRGLTNSTIISADLGLNPQDVVRSRASWGLPPDAQMGDRLWLPAGIVIPWYVDGAIWRISIRKLKPGDKAYYNVPGCANVPYGIDLVEPGKPAILVEGFFDTLAVQQAAGDLVAPVATGTTGARRMRWLLRLALCRAVLVSHDADAAGDEAAGYWQLVLGKAARRWRPLVDDPAKMLQAGMDLRAWVQAGLAEMHTAQGQAVTR